MSDQKFINSLLKDIADRNQTISEVKSEQKEATARIEKLRSKLKSAALDLAAARASAGDILIESATRGKLGASIDDNDAVDVFGTNPNGSKRFIVKNAKAAAVTAHDIASELNKLLSEKEKAFQPAAATPSEPIHELKDNPWLATAESPFGNLTRQGRIEKENPELATMLRAEAQVVRTNRSKVELADLPNLDLFHRAQRGDRDAQLELKARVHSRIEK